MRLEYLARPEFPRKPVQRSGVLERFTTLAGDGPVLTMTARFRRPSVRQAADRFSARHTDLNLLPSWRLFTSLRDWGQGWMEVHEAFAAALIFSAAGDPVVERAIARCLSDLTALGRPLLWGVVSDRLRWHPRFKLGPNGWPPETRAPDPETYARISVAHDAAEFRPQFDPILFLPNPQECIGLYLAWPRALRSTLDG